MRHLLTLALAMALVACNAGQQATYADTTSGTTSYTHIHNGEVLTLEDNGAAGYALYGTTTITRDADGLTNALVMRATLELVIADLQRNTQH